MSRIIAALALVCAVPGLASAQTLEIVAFRPCYGSNGAARKEAKNPKLVPGDVLWIDYAIDGLKVEPKTNKVRYDSMVEFFDSNGKSLLQRKTPNEAILYLGGNRMFADVHVFIGEKFPPGTYTIKLTVRDKLADKEVVKTYPLEVIPPTLAFVEVEAPALGVPGVGSFFRCSLTGFVVDPKDPKKKECNVEVTIQVLDANLKPVSLPNVTVFPHDIPQPVPAVVTHLPVVFPITYLNRPGQFYFDIVAVDRNATDKSGKAKEINLRLPLTVVDISSITAGK